MQKKYSGQAILDVLTVAKKYNDFLVRSMIASLPSTLDVVDFGAGIGTFAEKLRQKGLRVTCIEPDPSQQNILRQKKFTCRSSIDQMRDRTVAYLYSLNVLEHISDDQQVLHRIARKIRPGGKIFLYVPAMPALYSSLDKKVGHQRRYTKKGLSQKIIKAGLKIDRAEYVDSLGAFAALIYKHLGSRQGDLTRRQVFWYDRVLFPISRALDLFAHPFFGKNLLVVATKPSKT